MKWSSAGVLLLLLSVVPGMSVAWAACPLVPGDQTGEGNVDVVDVQCNIVVVLWDLGGGLGAPPDCLVGGFAAADLNCDAQASVVDTQLIISLVLGAGLSPDLDQDGNFCVDACEGEDVGPSCVDPASWPGSWAAFEAGVVAAINVQRAAGAVCDGIPYPPVGPVSAHPQLTEAARCHSSDMADGVFVGHEGTDGSYHAERIGATGYFPVISGENVAGGYPNPTAAVAGWVASPEHCKILMSPAFTQTGTGYFLQPGTPFVHYWTQVFATPFANTSCDALACGGNDGCCPFACTATNDPDCAPDCEEPATWPTNWSELELEVLDLLNAFRLSGGQCGPATVGPAPPLALHPSLQQASRCHADDMAANNFFGFQGTDGSFPPDRITSAGFVGSPVTESLSAAASTAQVAFDTWIAAPGTCQAILNPEFGFVGVGYAANPASNHFWYWTLDLGGF